MSSKKTPKVNGIFYDSVEYGGGLSENFEEKLSKRNEILNKKGKEEKKSKDIKKTKKDIFKYIDKLNKFSSNQLNSLILTKGKNPIFNKGEQIKLIFDLYDLRDMNGCFISLRNPDSEKIRNSFKDLETDSICNLLGINPELNFYSKSQLLKELERNFEEIFNKNEIQDTTINVLELSKEIYINNFAKKLGDDLTNIDDDWEDMPPVSKPKKQKRKTKKSSEKKSSKNRKDKTSLEFDENGRLIPPSKRKNRKPEAPKTKIKLDEEFFNHINYLIENKQKIIELNELISETPKSYISKTIRNNLLKENQELFLEWNKIKSTNSFNLIKKEFTHNFKIKEHSNLKRTYESVDKCDNNRFSLLWSNTIRRFEMPANLLALEKTDLLNLLNFLRTYNDLKNYKNLEKSRDNIIAKANERFISKEIKENKDIFNVEDYVLDNYQKRAVVIDEDNMQIIAGAGTGKTSTLQGKLKYLTKVKGIKEEDILCLSYSNAAVEDLNRKICKTLGKNNDVNVKTFHSLGAGILKWDDEDSRIFKGGLKSCIRKYFKKEIINNPTKIKLLVLFFSCYLRNPQLESEFKCGLGNSNGNLYKGDYSLKQKVLTYMDELGDKYNFKEFRKDYGGENEKITFKDEYVRSLEELVIANYLFINGIDYVYEKKYFVDKDYLDSHMANLSDLFFPESECIPYEIKRQLIYDLHIYDYYPDFYLPDYDVYIEHYGVNNKCQANWLKKDARKEYSDSIKWKREIHNMYGTTLIETYSYYTSEGRLLSTLRDKLEDYVEFKEVDYNIIYKVLLENEKLREFEDLISLISKFINLFKGNGYNIDENGEDCSQETFENFFKENEKNKSDFSKQRNMLFLKIIEEIYKYYSRDLKSKNKIDFNDMINNAIKSLKNGAYIHNYKYILVDEYQDTSKTRYNLLKTIQERTNAKIITVGDDWQSIYRFTGCDIKLFVNFDKYFESPELVKIRNTYRNSQELINISSKFIQKNKKQIKKDLISEKHRKNPVKICYFDSDKESVLILEDILNRIEKEDSDKNKKILILGRNNSDINAFLSNDLFSKDKNNNLTDDGYLDIIYNENPDMNLRFRTVHKSKGLEADYVILINLKDTIAGFPNKMINDEIIDMFFKGNHEKIEFAEERRLFYVALTRTKNDVYLIAPQNIHSGFINELNNNNTKNKKLIETLSNFNFSNEDYDRLNLKANTGKETTYTKLRCPNCKTGKVILITDHDNYSKFDNAPIQYFVCSNDFCNWRGGFYKGRMEDLEYIKNCNECGGVLIVKNGQYGHFLGCTNHRTDGTGCNNSSSKLIVKKKYDKLYGIRK